MDSSDIICIIKLTFSARGRALKLWSEEKPASVQTSWATKQWKRTCSIVSGALLHKLHVKGTFVPLVSNLSATANAPAATLHRNKRILGSVGIFQTLRFNSRVAWSCTMEFLTFLRIKPIPTLNCVCSILRVSPYLSVCNIANVHLKYTVHFIRWEQLIQQIFSPFPIGTY